MSKKIGLISDVHATPGPLQEALETLQAAGAETILCAGDIAGYGTELERTIALLIDSDCQVIAGNHDLWWLMRDDIDPAGPVARYLHSLPRVVTRDIVGRQIYMVHASPPASLMDGIRLLDEEGVLIEAEQRLWSRALHNLACDVLMVGHTHQVFAEQLGEVTVVNPGSTLFNHSCAVLSLPEMEVEVFGLGGKGPLLSWNWGMLGDAGFR